MSQSTISTIKSMNHSFHTKYLTLCKAKNHLPNHEIIKNKIKLEIVADRMKLYEWQLITKALEQDNSLQCIDIVSRRAVQCVKEEINTEKSCRDATAKGDPIISTKFIFQPLIKSVSNCVRHSTELQSLALEGLPLTVVYIQSIANAILQNNSLKMLSFARSNLMDDGCVIICSTIKHLSHIEKINFAHCDLTDHSAVHISDLIKFQTINRYSEEWMKSFRYQDVHGTPPGLKCLILNGNVELGDKGLQRIAMNLKDDEWIKAIEFRNCGLTDTGGLAALDCLKCNKALAIFDVSFNPKMGKRIFNQIQRALGADPDNFEVDRKDSRMRLKETIELLEQRLEIETTNREQANKTNVELLNKLKEVEDVKLKQEVELPAGLLLIDEAVLKALHKQLEDLEQSEVALNDAEPSQSGSEQTVFGDSNRLGNVHEEMSKTSETITAREDQQHFNDESSLFEVNRGRMKSMYTMFSADTEVIHQILQEPVASVDGDETTHSDHN